MHQTLVPGKDVVYTDFNGASGILVDLNTKQYYQLNETGSLIWRELENGMTVQDIVLKMQNIYEVSAEHARASIEKLLHNLETRKLVGRS